MTHKYEDTPAMRAMREKRKSRDDAMLLALLILYEDMASIIDSNTAWTLSALGGGLAQAEAKWDCVKVALSEDARGGPELRDEVEPYLEAIRAIEAHIGRHLSPIAFEWVRRVIDGEAGI